MTRQPDNTGVALFLTTLALGLFLVVVAGVGAEPVAFPSEAGSQVAPTGQSAEPTRPAQPPPSSESTEPAAFSAPTAFTAPTATPTLEPKPDPVALPHGSRRIFDGRMLVAYYGTATTGVLGVLGETSPERALKRLTAAAAPFRRDGLKPQPVFELIVTVADARPGTGGDYNHDISRRAVREYVDAAHRLGVLLLLDIQPGRAPFDQVARRWEWALRKPWVGLALDPEWRMYGRGVPGRAIGTVRAPEVNRTSAWLDRLAERHGLPQKLFVLHQFRTAMIPRIDLIQRRPNLAMVQHVDGFGTRGQKLDTYRVVAAPKQFRMGFKLFYDEDTRLMRARDVKRIRPRVDFVSYQ